MYRKFTREGESMFKQDIWFSLKYPDYEGSFISDRLWRVDGFYEPHVYIVQESSTRRYYIGSRTKYSNPKSRDDDVGRTYLTSSTYIREKWKLNEKQFIVEQIIKCASNHDAFILELLLIKIHNALYSKDFLNKGHPILGFDTSGVPKTEEHRKKIGQGNIDNWNKKTDEEKSLVSEKLKLAAIEKYEDDVVKNKIRDGMIKFSSSEDGITATKSRADRISYLHKIGHYNESYKKISIKTKGTPKPDGFGNKLSKARKGWNPSEKTRNRMSQARKGKYTGEDNIMSNPESRKRVSESKVGRKRVYLKDGGFIYAKPDELHLYYAHKDKKYYDYPEP